MAQIDKMIDDIIRIEGGYSDHKDDSGGKTRYGIIESVARKWGYHGDMKKLPMELAKTIYKEEYYIEPNFVSVGALSTKLGVELFDTGVNCGVRTASKFLQRCLNVLNQQAKLYPDLVVDGQLGRLSIAALSAYLRRRGKEGETVLLRMLNALQGAYYIELAERREKDESFIYGWILHRVVI